jgi:hypothetical protein
MRTVDVIVEVLVSWSLHQRDAPIGARERLAASLPTAMDRVAGLRYHPIPIPNTRPDFIDALAAIVREL